MGPQVRREELRLRGIRQERLEHDPLGPRPIRRRLSADPPGAHERRHEQRAD